MIVKLLREGDKRGDTDPAAATAAVAIFRGDPPDDDEAGEPRGPRCWVGGGWRPLPPLLAWLGLAHPAGEQAGRGGGELTAAAASSSSCRSPPSSSPSVRREWSSSAGR